MAWLYPFVDGHPPIGWDEASRYLALPVLLVIAQFISTAVISPPIDPNDENAKTQKAIFAFLPLMIGYFSLNVPAGLSLYYFANSVLTTAQQYWLRKLGGEGSTPTCHITWSLNSGNDRAKRMRMAANYATLVSSGGSLETSTC